MTRSGGMDTMAVRDTVAAMVEDTVVDMVGTCQAMAGMVVDMVITPVKDMGTTVDMVMSTDMVVAVEDTVLAVDTVVVDMEGTVVEDMVVEGTWERDTAEVDIDSWRYIYNL
jgi:hypothetical protein